MLSAVCKDDSETGVVAFVPFASGLVTVQPSAAAPIIILAGLNCRKNVWRAQMGTGWLARS